MPPNWNTPAELEAAAAVGFPPKLKTPAFPAAFPSVEEDDAPNGGNEAEADALAGGSLPKVVVDADLVAPPNVKLLGVDELEVGPPNLKTSVFGGCAVEVLPPKENDFVGC